MTRHFQFISRKIKCSKIGNYVFLCVFIFASGCSEMLLAQHKVTPTNEFDVTGFVKKELRIQINHLASFKQDSLGDIIVRNRKGEGKGKATQLKGILLKTIIDSAGIVVDKPKEYGSICIVLTASDGYENVYSWGELFNTEVGDHIYLITQKDGKPITEMEDRILVLSLADFNSGNRHLKGLKHINVRKIK